LLLEANVTQIKFGTSGWRGILAEDFTFENVKIDPQAIAEALRGQGLGERGVVMGYEARVMGNRFAAETARVLAGAGIKAPRSRSSRRPKPNSSRPPARSPRRPVSFRAALRRDPRSSSA
jgi:phosphoglucomutase